MAAMLTSMLTRLWPMERSEKMHTLLTAAGR